MDRDAIRGMSVPAARALAKAAADSIRPVAPTVADAILRGAWKGELKAYREHFAAMAALGAAISTWSPEPDRVAFGLRIEGLAR